MQQLQKRIDWRKNNVKHGDYGKRAKWKNFSLCKFLLLLLFDCYLFFFFSLLFVCIFVFCSVCVFFWLVKFEIWKHNYCCCCRENWNNISLTQLFRIFFSLISFLRFVFDNFTFRNFFCFHFFHFILFVYSCYYRIQLY